MNPWAEWLQLLDGSLSFLTTNVGLSEAMAIVVLTLVARAMMMPVSLGAAYRAQRNKQALERIKPALEQLRETFKDNPAELAARTMALYREQGIRFFDKLTLLNIGTQASFGLGAFQVLKRSAFASPFLWIASLAKPDVLLTLLVGALMLLSLSLMPGVGADASAWVMFAIPVLLSVVAVAALPSALGVYWATSNAVGVAQSLALRALLTKRRSEAA
jgi:YidC/Oxa1 family membrane protein insertase